MSDLAVTVENLGKAYRIGLEEEKHTTLTGAAMSWLRAPARNLRRLNRLNTFSSKRDSADEADTIWALRDVNFEIREGEVVGVIGRNGAGKSTLLKILSRITDPTTGRAEIHGRVSSLLEVGTGFHPELTGRENVYMNGTILGMSKREIDRKFDEIAAFSGVESFLDTPVKRYSSGMKVRLAFSVAAHLEPEILIIDEVLAVGDAEFQSKCLGRMNSLAGSGRTVLFVSHNMAAIQSLCTKAILLEGGKVATTGTVAEVTSRYMATANAEPSHQSSCYSTSAGQRLIQRLRVTDPNQTLNHSFSAGSTICLHADLQTQGSVAGITVRFAIVTPSGFRVATCNSRIETGRLLSFNESVTVTCFLTEQRLSPGKYHVSAAVLDHGKELDAVEGALAFEVLPADIFGTGRLPSAHKAVYLPVTSWRVQDSSGPERLLSATALRSRAE